MENKNGFMMVVILATMALGMVYVVESSNCSSKIEEACRNMTAKCCKTLRDLYENEYVCLCTYIKENNFTVAQVAAYVTACNIPAAETENPCPGYLNFSKIVLPAKKFQCHQYNLVFLVNFYDAYDKTLFYLQLQISQRLKIIYQVKNPSLSTYSSWLNSLFFSILIVLFNQLTNSYCL